MRQTLPLLLALAATPALAQETRQLDAHEHGVGTLDIAVDGKDVLMAFHAPGADIVGFEYGAASAADIEAVQGALAVLARPSGLFALPEAAGCAVVRASAELESEEAHEGEHGDHAGKGHDDHDDHADEDHDDHADEGHDHGEHDHEEHAHDDHATEASHTEFHAEYRLTCADPSAIDRMTFPYFDAFQNAREVEVQVVTSSGAQAFEVTRGAPVLDLDGLF